MITKKHLWAVLMDTRSDVTWLYRKVERLERTIEELSKQDTHIEVTTKPSKAEKVKVACKAETPEKKRGRGRPRKNA